MEKPPSAPGRVAEQRVEGFVWQEMKDDQKQYEIIADVAEVFMKEQIAVLKQVDKLVEARTYSDQGMVTLFARQITYNFNTKDAEAQGDVMVVSDEGTVLKTSNLQWLGSLGKIKTKDPVTIDRQGLHLAGTGLEANTHLENIKFFGRPQTTIQGSGVKLFKKRKEE